MQTVYLDGATDPALERDWPPGLRQTMEWWTCCHDYRDGGGVCTECAWHTDTENGTTDRKDSSKDSIFGPMPYEPVAARAFRIAWLEKELACRHLWPTRKDYLLKSLAELRLLQE